MRESQAVTAAASRPIPLDLGAVLRETVESLIIVRCRAGAEAAERFPAP